MPCNPEPPPAIPTLPLHLLLSMGCWLSSPFGLRCAKNALPHLSASLRKALKNPQPGLEQAVEAEAKQRVSRLLEGAARYYGAPLISPSREQPCVWRRGNARLLDYGHGQCVPDAIQQVVLVVPSLINRYYILDLEPQSSLLRYLPTQGLYPLVLDWGTPGAFEKEFYCEDYIQQLLVEAIGFAHRFAGQRIVLAGYCMGGVLALGAAQLVKRQLGALALFATPWDFHCEAFQPFLAGSAVRLALEAMLARGEMLPPAIIQLLFYLTDPFVFEHKFRRFADMPTDSAVAQDFLAVEQWVNDGVPLTARVARDCLLGWMQDNQLARGQWQVGGKPVRPQSLTLPLFMAIPKNDTVVPMGCALPLTKCLPHATVIHPGAGHVSMMVGQRAKQECWQPFVRWLLALPGK